MLFTGSRSLHNATLRIGYVTTMLSSEMSRERNKAWISIENFVDKTTTVSSPGTPQGFTENLVRATGFSLLIDDFKHPGLTDLTFFMCKYHGAAASIRSLQQTVLAATVMLPFATRSARGRPQNTIRWESMGRLCPICHSRKTTESR